MRASLGGSDVPREEFAIIGIGESTGIPVILLPADGDVFIAEDYISLGYTNYEVVCIGAAGGRGGAAVGGGAMTFAAGGAGGGGGLHHVTGLLADLPDPVPIVIGQGGADGRDSSPGNIPPLRGELNSASQFAYVLDGDGFAIDLELLDNPDYISPLAGADGGETSFGTICRASGGKGGSPAQLIVVEPFPLWGPQYSGGYGGLFYTFYFISGEGGEGGLGDRDLSGGGGLAGVVDHTPAGHSFGPEVVTVYANGYTVARSQTHTTPEAFAYTKPKDGTWDGNVGEGGGGGYGGSKHAPVKEASAGSKGSMNYGDISVYGPGEMPHYDNVGALMYPGSGGGAKLSKLARYGSHAPAYNPNGVLQIRLTKLV